MKENSLAKRYAKGLIKSIRNPGEYDDIKRQLDEFFRLLQANPEFKSGMETMLFSVNQKKDLLDAIRQKTDLSDKTNNFLVSLIEENRIAILGLIIQVLEQLWLEANGSEKLKVFSVTPLKESLEKELIISLEKAFGKKIILEKAIDPSLIAGIKIQRGSTFYDFSIEGNLKKLKEALLTEAFAEER